MHKQLELKHRDQIECVKALVLIGGNPVFEDFILYVPERVYVDDKGRIRVFDEMWTGTWWWETQV
jgi:hypothetical protein